MWQNPNFCPKDPTSNIWYTKGHLGKTLLGNFITDLCEKVGKMKRYTNHCLRVCSTNIVTKSVKFNTKEVMDFAGHKSVQSLTIYQRVQPENNGNGEAS